MPLYLTEDQMAFQDTIRDFIAEAAPVAQTRALRDANDPVGFSRNLWKQFAEMGFTGILIGEEQGGLGLGHVEAGIVLEEIGRNLSPSPFLTTAITAVEALKGTPHADRWFPGILAGDVVVAVAVDEHPKHGGPISCRAERSGNGFRISGSKRFIVHGHVADLMIVAARTTGSPTDDEGLTLFALPSGVAKFALGSERLVDTSIVACATFENIQIDADAVIGGVDNGRAGLDALMRAGRVAASAEMLGVGDGAMERTINYLRTRKQFGLPIGCFQALQHRAAHLYAEMEIARAALIKSQQRLDADAADADTAASIAKAMTAMAATLSVQESVQMHGGIGMTDEYDIGLYMKRARVLTEMFGDVNYHADRIATASGY